MSEWRFYRRKVRRVEFRPFVPGEALPEHVSVSRADRITGHPKAGDMIARSPHNHSDQWLVAEKFFKENYESEPEE